MIQVFKPSLGEEEVEAVRQVLSTGWIGLGPKTEEFEESFARYVGAEYAVAVNSATAGLHLACEALGFYAGKNTYLIPAITFVSTAFAPEYCGGKVQFVDVEPRHLNINPQEVFHKLFPTVVGMIPVHYAGHPCDMERLWALAADHNLFVIEDAAHACGAEYNNVKIGGHGKSNAVVFSFHAVKNLTTGDGGMVVTDDAFIAKKVRELRWLGINRSTWERTEEVNAGHYKAYGWYYEVWNRGYKYHMNDIAAAIGLVQLSKLSKMNARRREIANYYSAALFDLEWLELPTEEPNVKSSWHIYAIRTPCRDALNLYMKDQGIATGVHYIPLPLQPYYRKAFCDIPVAAKVWTGLLSLPMYPDLTDAELETIVKAIRRFDPGDSRKARSS